jgi:hypothetical protein
LLAEQQRIAAEKAAKEAEDRRKQQLAEQQRIAAEKAENKQKQQLAEQQHASVWQSTNNNTKYKVSVTPSMTPGCKSTITEVYGDGQKRELIPTYLCKQPDGTWKEEQIENATTDTPSDNYQQSAKGGESLLSRMDGEQREIIPKQDITENSAASSGESEFDKLVSEIMKKMGINTERAEKFIFMVQDTAQKLQENLTRIASHETSKAEKQKLVRATIDEFFVDGFKSTVQTVMLKNQPTITNVAAATYLNELLKLSDHYVVELLFDKEYLHLSTGTIKRLEDNNKISYIFNVKMWQMVKICKDHGAFCDTNYTQQGVNFIFKQESSSWKLRVKYITTTKPIPFREGRYGKLEH